MNIEKNWVNTKINYNTHKIYILISIKYFELLKSVIITRTDREKGEAQCNFI